MFPARVRITAATSPAKQVRPGRNSPARLLAVLINSSSVIDAFICSTLIPVASIRNEKLIAHIERVESADVTESLFPHTRFEVGFEPRDAACNDS